MYVQKLKKYSLNLKKKSEAEIQDQQIMLL